jgi:GAF domain-containing protein
LEKLLDEVATRAQELLATQGRLRDLLHAQSMVSSELDLPAVLQHIVVAARDLVEARYAALGVVGATGDLDEFVHVGMDEATVERIGDLPQGRGILGLLVGHSDPVRLVDLTGHPAAAGFPAHHPVMDSFLGVPIRIRDRVFGHVYLTGSANGQFSEEDEQLAVALASTAGAAIDNAHLYRESEQRRQWLAASAAMTQVLFAGADVDPLDAVLRSAQQTSDADFATLSLVVGSGQLQVKAASGVLTEHVLGQVIDIESSMTGQVVQSGTPVLVEDYTKVRGANLPVPIGSVIVVPAQAGDEPMGALSVGRLAGRCPFTETDVTHLAGFAGHAGVAIELARARAERQDRRIVDDRDRIGIDLNDHVIQKLVTVGLGLQGLSMMTSAPAARARITEYIALIDATINHIRTTVFNITTTDRHQLRDLQHRILEVADDQTAALGCQVATTITGRLNRTIPPWFTDDAVTVVRKALSNIAAHAHATHVELRLDVTDDLTIEIIHNDPDTTTPAWIAAQTALRRQTGILVSPAPDGSHTHLVWTAPIPNSH